MRWIITRYGLEFTGPGKYMIAKGRLSDLRPGTKNIADWPLHMAEKNWVCAEDFLEVWQRAVLKHVGSFGPIDLAETRRAMWKV